MIFNIGSTEDNSFNSSQVVLHNTDIPVYAEANDVKDHNTETGNYETVKEFKNPIYGDDDDDDDEDKVVSELQHEYETADEVRSKSKTDHQFHSDSDQDEELERKFENPIYGDDLYDGIENLTVAVPLPQASGGTVDYDQIGHIYHTLESEQEREQRYARTSVSEAASMETGGVNDSVNGGERKKPKHNYEDVQ